MRKFQSYELSLMVGGALLATTSLLSCKSKPAAATDVKSLGNVVANANGTAVTNEVCGPNVSASFSVDPQGLSAQQLDLAQRKVAILQNLVDSPDAAAKAAAISGLAAAPTTLLTVLFEAIGARVVLTNDNVAECAAVQADTLAVPEEAELIGNGTTLATCWLPPSAEHPQLRLILPVDAAKARANVLQLAAFAFTEYVYKRASTLTTPPFSTEPLHSKMLSFAVDNAQLAAQFLTELNGNPAVTGLATLNKANPVAFGFLVYANSLDSYYCSAATRSAAAKKFPQTMDLFHSLYVVPDLGEQ